MNRTCLFSTVTKASALAAAVIIVALTGPAVLPTQAQEELEGATSAQQAPQQGAAINSRRDLPVDPPALTALAWTPIGGPPVPVKGTDGRIHLAYEMLFTNLSATPARVVSVEVVDPIRRNRVVGTSRVVTIKDEDVSAKLRQFALPQPTLAGADFTDRLRPARSAVLYLDVTFDDWRDVPARIKHRVTFSQTDAQNNVVLSAGVGGLLDVSKDEPVVLGPPLKGDGWVDGSGCCEIVSPHRYTILPMNGTMRPPEHFAIDFIRLDAQGRAVVGDIKILNNWPFYGAEIVAAAGGRVIEVVNDLPDQVPGELPAGVTVETAAGNHVIVDMGGGRYALYAHLIPNSVAVGEGDVVERGQYLGRLGNSGNTDAPHLHFQVMDRPSPLDANGLPFVFDRMELRGRMMGSLDDINNTIFAGAAPQIDSSTNGRRRRQMPLTKDVLNFK